MSSLPADIHHALREHLGDVRAVKPIAGGCIANASFVDAASGPAFLKWAPGEAGETFAAEARGLRALRAASAPLAIPDVYAVRNASARQPGFLLLEWIERGASGAAHERALGEGLAILHRHTEPEKRYGFEEDNFIGRLPQLNGWRDHWPTFFAENRLAPQIERARRSGAWDQSWDPLAEHLLARLESILPAHPAPAICHGDLWSGNAMATASGAPALFDPAASFGHGEADLAMMTLFGGFGGAVFEAYHEVHPREPGHDEREAVYQLYHMINHLNHFGSGYAGGVLRLLRSLA